MLLKTLLLKQSGQLMNSCVRMIENTDRLLEK
jgi:hypothetical protein